MNVLSNWESVSTWAQVGGIGRAQGSCTGRNMHGDQRGNCHLEIGKVPE